MEPCNRIRRSRRCHRYRGWAASGLAGVSLMALVLPAAQGAAYLPGAEADPPTGDAPAPTAPTPAEPLRGNGIEWRFGPWRTAGSIGLDARWLRFEDGGSTSQGALLFDIETASYIWQPWFMQLRLGAGLVAASDSGRDSGQNLASTGNSFTGHADLSIFPASRFPFSLRAEASDSRASGQTLGNDWRTRRLTLSQSYRPESGNDHYRVQVDASQLLSDGQRDTLVTLDADAMQLRGAHRFELGLNLADNRNDGERDRTRLASVTGRHGFHPSAMLGVDSLASWHQIKSRLGDGSLAANDFGNEVRQVSSLLTWRPRNGDLPMGLPSSTLVVGSARWVESRGIGSLAGPALTSMNATLGASTDLNAAWRIAGSVAANHIDNGIGEPADTASVNASAHWAPRLAGTLGGWRYAPSLSLAAGLTRGDEASQREFAAVQASHSVSRDVVREGQDMVSLSAAQSLSWLTDAGVVARETSATLTHSLGVVWQSLADPSQQRFASASVSDSRTHADERGSFQLLNLQWTQRTQLSRLSSWSGSLTWQASRSRLTQIDLLTGEQFDFDGHWQHFASGTLHYEQQRVFGVPRLRLSLLGAVSTQQLQRRSAGDIDAPLEYVSRSLEARLDYTVGRLEARLSARAARVDERSVAAVIARVTRRF
jgi:hypothetical protein